jgi:hypothetical protein
MMRLAVASTCASSRWSHRSAVVRSSTCCSAARTVRDEDPRPLARECRRHAASNTARGAGHPGNTVCEVHDSSLTATKDGQTYYALHLLRTAPTAHGTNHARHLPRTAPTAVRTALEATGAKAHDTRRGRTVGRPRLPARL